MVAVSFSTDFGAQVQLLQSRMASGDYDLAQVHAARLDEFDFLFSNTSSTSGGGCSQDAVAVDPW